MRPAGRRWVDMPRSRRRSAFSTSRRIDSGRELSEDERGCVVQRHGWSCEARVRGCDSGAVTGPPDFIAAVAELNARVRQRARRARAIAGRAMLSGDRDQLVRALQNTLDLLDAVVVDLTESRAEGATVYHREPTFRRAVDQAPDDD